LPAGSPELPLIETCGIVKKFGALAANDNVCFDLRAGEIHGLLGENGAGKSTLCKILYGYYRPDEGEIRVEGKRVTISSPADARALGIGMVFQTFTLIPALSVLENIALFLRDVPFVLRPDQIGRHVEGFARRFGFQMSLGAQAGRLSAGEQQQVEILKQLLAGARVLILDEPTKVLTPQESEGLFRSMAALKADRYAVVFISHKLPEVLACADRITVMRRGRIAGCLTAAEADEAKLLQLMFERTPTAPWVRPEAESGKMSALLALELTAASTDSAVGPCPLRDISLKLHPGEIVGIAGISGNGQRELADLILGAAKLSGGSKRMWGEDASRWSILEIRSRGAAAISDDPNAFASAAGLSVRENLALGTDRKFQTRFGMNWPKLEETLKAAYARFRFARPDFGAKAGTLSGGNLQRMVLVRELSRDPRLIVALYPTRGLDVRSASAVRDLLLEARGEGAAILLFSEELEELFTLCDSLAVLNHGRLVAWFSAPHYQVETIGSWMVAAAELSYAA
jgi:simple sugar transport system ATP-binding protein